MALQKDFKVKDTINVGVSGLFGSGIRIGDGSTFPSATPAIDAWGPILSGGYDISDFFGDGIDNIKEGSQTQGTIQFQTQNDAWTFGRTGDSNDDVWTDVEVLGLQGYDSPTFTNLVLSGTNDVAYLSAASTLIIDPMAANEDKDGIGGTVRIKGDLYVDGTTTTINSSTVSLSDAVVQLGYGEDQFLDADGKVPTGGVGVQAGSIADATILYKGTDGWEINGNSLTSLVDFNVGTSSDLFQVEASSGNIYTDGTLSVNGDTTLSGAFTIVNPDGATAATTLNITQAGAIDGESTLNIAGLATFENDGTDGETVAVKSTGGVSLSGDLRVDDHGSSDTNYFLVDNSTGLTTIADLTVSDLTENQIVLPDANKNLEGSADFTFDGTTFDVGQGKFTATTAGVVYADSDVGINGTTSLSGDLTISTDGTDSTQKFSVTQATGDVHTEGSITAVGSTTLSGDLTIKTTGTESTVFTVDDANGNVTTQGTLEVEGETTLNDVLTLSGHDLTASSKTAVYTGVTVAAAAADSYIATLPAANLNSAKYIVTVDAEGDKSVIELLVAQTDAGAVDGTAYGQVDVKANAGDDAQLQDITVALDGSTIGISVTGASADTAVTIFATGYYN
jgi:hypothetical protein